MSVWSKMVTALRGNAHELGDALVDGNAMMILDQEIRDADEELKKSKQALAEIMAKKKLAAEKTANVGKKLEEYEGYVVQALDKGDEKLAEEVAGKVAMIEEELDGEKSVEAGFAESVGTLRKSVAQAEGQLKRLKQQADTVKATESVQKAQSAVAARYSGTDSKMRTATDSLERIKQKQAERAARMSAASELAAEETTDELADKLRAAGITNSAHSAQAVLERIKAKKK